MDILEVIKSRRSVRAFKAEPVPEETLRKLVEAACWAPSGSNMQSWQFVILRNQEQMKKVFRFSPGLFAVPPAMLFICVDKDRALAKGGEMGRDVMSLFDTAMAAQNVLLQAQSMGLGACVLCGFDQRAVQILLELPGHVKPELLIILGFPKVVPRAPTRRPVDEVLHFEKWGG